MEQLTPGTYRKGGKTYQAVSSPEDAGTQKRITNLTEDSGVLKCSKDNGNTFEEITVSNAQHAEIVATAESAERADTASYADGATNDSEGRNIAETYVTKDEVIQLDKGGTGGTTAAGAMKNLIDGLTDFTYPTDAMKIPLNVEGTAGTAIKTTIGNLYENNLKSKVVATKVSSASAADSADGLATARAIDGVSFDGSADVMHYGVCTSGADDLIKTVSIPNFTLQAGAHAIVKFTYANAQIDAYLNINLTGAKSIYYGGRPENPPLISAGSVIHFVYDGTRYNVVGFTKSGENILINPDFKINQRGQSSYVGTTSGTYTVDRWKSYVSTVVPSSSGGITVVGSAGYALLRQDIENYGDYLGKTLTLSVKITSITGSLSLSFYNNTGLLLGTTITGIGTYSVTYAPPTTSTSLYVALTGIGSTSSSATVAYMKLEVGAEATEFVPPNSTTELLKCQRYFYRLSTKDANNYAILTGAGWMQSTTNFRTLVQFPATLRRAPTITKSGSFVLSAAGTQYQITSFDYQSWLGDKMSLQVNTASSLATNTLTYLQASNDTTAYIDFDAEL